MAERRKCAACRDLRIRCKPDCPFAPYFPYPAANLDFLHAKKLFGASNILKTIRQFPSVSVRNNAVKSMIYQAKARAINPASGCLGFIYQLQSQIQYTERELHIARQQIADHKRFIDYVYSLQQQAMQIRSMDNEFSKEITVVERNIEPSKDYDRVTQILEKEESEDDTRNFTAGFNKQLDRIYQDYKKTLDGRDEKDQQPIQHEEEEQKQQSDQ